MTNQIIVPDDGPILIEDSSCPVRERGKINGIFKDLHDAEVATGIPKATIASMADAGDAVKGHKFSWPTLKEVRAIWDYPILRTKRSGTRAVAVEVTLSPAPGTRVQPKLYYRSIMSCCRAWGITISTLHHISSRSKGWKDMLPEMVESIRVDVSLPKKQGTQEREEAILPLRLRQLKGGLQLTLSKPMTFNRVQDVPEGILAHSTWSN